MEITFNISFYFATSVANLESRTGREYLACPPSTTFVTDD